MASAALARLDERLRLLPFADGVCERLVYFEACAVRHRVLDDVV